MLTNAQTQTLNALAGGPVSQVEILDRYFNVSPLWYSFSQLKELAEAGLIRRLEVDGVALLEMTARGRERLER